MVWVFLFFLAIIGLIVHEAYLFSHRHHIAPEQEAPPELDQQSNIEQLFRNLWYNFAGFGTVSARAWAVRAGLILVGILSLAFTSYINPDAGKVALLTRLYICSPVTDGRFIAKPGECGRQSEIRMPGFQFSPLINVLYDVSTVDMVSVPQGTYATLVAKDGIPLDAGQIAAKPWPILVPDQNPAKEAKPTPSMLDASYFLGDGHGHKGPQTSILTPGLYPMNTYLWDVSVGLGTGNGGRNDNSLTVIEPGQVGVIKSAIDEDTVPSFMPNKGQATICNQRGATTEKDLGQIKAVLVAVGCRGVWRESLTAGTYYLNRHIYSVTNVDTRIQNWVYQGGYTRRQVDLTVSEEGKITQTPREESVPQGPENAGEAVIIKVEGWSVFQEVRLQARVKPDAAPLVVAAVGAAKEIEDKIITPQVKSVLRDIGGSQITVKNTAAYEESRAELDALKARLAELKEAGKDKTIDLGLTPEQRATETAQLERQIAGFVMPPADKEVTRPTRVLDFQNERQAIEKLVSDQIKKIGDETGIEIVSVTLGNADLPPELLMARKMEQLSSQLRNAFVQIRSTQVTRQSTEAAKARADKQGDLVAASIGVETSKLGIDKRTNEGQAEKAYLTLQAEGQKAQAEVLGADKVAMLKALDQFLQHPELLTNLKLPNTMVIGGSPSGLDGPMAVLGAALKSGSATSAGQTRQ